MKLDVRAAAVATGNMAVLVYALCTAFCILVPEPTVVGSQPATKVCLAIVPSVTVQASPA
jgi:hypothetical protein